MVGFNIYHMVGFFWLLLLWAKRGNTMWKQWTTVLRVLVWWKHVSVGLPCALDCLQHAAYPRSTCWIIDASVNATLREGKRERERECVERQIKEIRAITLNPTRINNTRYFYLFRHCTALWTRARPSTRSNYRHNTRLWGSLVSFKQQGPQCCAQAKPPVQAPMKTMMLILFASFIEGSRASSEAPEGSPAVCVLCLDESLAATHQICLQDQAHRTQETSGHDTESFKIHSR